MVTLRKQLLDDLLLILIVLVLVHVILDTTLGLVKKGFLKKVKTGRGFSFVAVEGLEKKIGE